MNALLISSIILLILWCIVGGWIFLEADVGDSMEEWNWLQCFFVAILLGPLVLLGTILRAIFVFLGILKF